MSFPRLALLVLCLPLLLGGCAGAAVTAVSYGADGASFLETGKTTTDHFASMVSKKDCALWRVFRSQSICRERPEGSKDPYHVSYDTAERMPSEDGVAYAPPLRPAAEAPATSWTEDAYKPPAATPEPAPPPPVVASVEPPPPVSEKPSAPKPVKKKVAKARLPPKPPVRKPSPDPAATDP